MIKLECRCGHALELPDRVAGRLIRCKHCDKKLRVPQPRYERPAAPTAPVEEDLLVEGSLPCPSCGRTYPPAIVVCTECGVNIETGAMLYASVEEGPAASSPAEGGASPTVVGRLLRMLGLKKDPEEGHGR